MRETTKGGTNNYRISLTLGALQNCGRFMESVLRQLQKYGCSIHVFDRLIWHQAAMFVRTCIDVMNAHRKALRKIYIISSSLEVQGCFIACVNTM
ncbi:unnamed protein product [Sphagnum troendelagicum]|uniref:Uncharacterized protein n=1 Tax=Sphagnum troendelagicum TaxID=128251 RepID=A0ABP0T9U7_9BRYO